MICIRASPVRRSVTRNHVGRFIGALRAINHQVSPGKLSGKKSARLTLRNIGIIAHINAGKTTTTERMLYHAGSTETVGDVDKGNTVTDYLSQERDRGITITSAAVTFNWNRHQINLVDTPGHIDFTVEVERSLSVLDGAVTILDSAAGVEAQTLTVWNQASKYRIPNIIFLNKYDKPRADYKMCIDDMSKMLQMNALLVQLPVKTQGDFSTIIDIPQIKCLEWRDPTRNHGTKFDSVDLTKSGLDHKILEQVHAHREKLVNTLTDIDDEFASHVIECDKIADVSAEAIHQALRRATVASQICPVLLGSSYKCVGVQQLMDAIVSYLPSPQDRETSVRSFLSPNAEMHPFQHSRDSCCAFIFKITHDKRFGPLSYLRVCNGSLSKSTKLHNLDTQRPETFKKIYRAFADEIQEINETVEKGDIVLVSGMKESRTGDILTEADMLISDDHDKGRTSVVDDQQPFRLISGDVIVPQIKRFEPVYYCTIEASNSSQQVKLEAALGCLTREDPSLSFEVDSIGLTTIRGMGKLHLDIIKDRLRTEYGLESYLGPLQVSYRETITGSKIETLEVTRVIGNTKSHVTLVVRVKSKPNSATWSGKQLKLDTHGENSLSHLRTDHRKAIVTGFLSALSHGPLRGYPVINCDITLMDFIANGRASLAVISSSASQCLTNAITNCSPSLLEPIMKLELVVPQQCNSLITGDISMRRGHIESVQARNNDFVLVRACAPLAALADYSEFLRTTTSGRGSLSMELYNYEAMNEADKFSVTRQ